MSLVTYDDPVAAASGAARRVAEMIGETEDRFTLGLAGGSTPALTYETLRGLEVDWSRVVAWLSDERWVPGHDERCNGRMAGETLFDHVAATLHRPRWSEFLDAGDSAAHYEATIRSFLGGQRPDLVLLGLGEDGHTASLFPNSTALEETHRWYVATVIPGTGEQRLTATFPLLWSAREIIVLAVGENKAGAVRDSLAGHGPAGRIGEGKAKVEWHVDLAAASLLP